MKKLILVAVVAYALVAITPLMAKDNEPAQRFDAAAAVFSEVMGTPDKGIPQEMLEHAHCIVIVPDLKTGSVHRRREIRERCPFLQKQSRTGLVRAGHRPHRRRQCWLSDRRFVDRPDHAGDE